MIYFLIYILHVLCVNGTTISGDTFIKIEQTFIQNAYKIFQGVTKIRCCGICGQKSTCRSVNYNQVSKECQLVAVPFSVAAESALAQYNTSWDVYTTRATEWTLVFRGTQGTGGEIYAAWTNGVNVTTHDVTCMSTDVTSCNQHYRNPAVDLWPTFVTFPLKVKFALYKSGQEVAYVIFDGTGSNVTSWFSSTSVIDSTWTNLTADNFNYFSLDGYRQRRFYINRNFGGCDADTTYTITIETSIADCVFDAPDTFPQFLYSKSASYGYPNTMIGMDRADVMAIYTMIA